MTKQALSFSRKDPAKFFKTLNKRVNDYQNSRFINIDGLTINDRKAPVRNDEMLKC